MKTEKGYNKTHYKQISEVKDKYKIIKNTNKNVRVTYKELHTRAPPPPRLLVKNSVYQSKPVESRNLKETFQVRKEC